MQRKGNVDVNTYISGDGPEIENENLPTRDDESTDTEGRRDTETIPLPPDSKPAVPIEEPPNPEHDVKKIAE